ncbi:hypothetical protein [Azospirillum sp. TSO35-2]|uniref:hypothetical protein n=1 Tax=Azospirillum sp. TSO35-2 TaxID=716796 RepID=UPI000D60715B|nr:hypothetical protein [Azospirillum sp. TSO35-2]PWC36021.1 hypothetical protein TSO352_12645 [Azospirillum sp. TSO35-2]
MCRSDELDRMMMASLTPSAVGLLLPPEDDTDADHRAGVATLIGLGLVAASLLPLLSAWR